MTTLILSEEDAKLFLLFRANQANFITLLNAGTFELKNGSMEVHFNKEGLISSIDLHAKVYRREISK